MTVINALVRAQQSAAANDELYGAILAMRRAVVHLESAGRYPQAARVLAKAAAIQKLKADLQGQYAKESA
jgi:hypothetical protein